jgi:hypothetical protein
MYWRSDLCTNDLNLLARSHPCIFCRCHVPGDCGPQIEDPPAPVPTLACSAYYPQESFEFRAVVSNVQPQAACCPVFRCPPDGSATHSLTSHSSISLHNAMKVKFSLYTPWRRMWKWSTALLIFNHGIKWRRVVSFIIRAIYPPPPGKSPWCPLNRKLDGP